MFGSFIFTAVLALVASVSAQCGSGTADVTVTGSGTFTVKKGSSTVYTGTDYLAAINSGITNTASGQRLVVSSSGSIGANTITIKSGITFEGCGTINVGYRAAHGAIEILNNSGTKIPYLTLTGAPYFAVRVYGSKDITFGVITMNLTGGIGIRFDRDQAANSNIKMDTVSVTGATSHGIETWNIAGFSINKFTGRNLGECGLLVQATTNAKIGTVDCDNCGAGTGYAALRFANQNGKLNGGYSTNIYVDKLIAKGGGRGLFCVSESGAAEITTVDISGTENNAILIENCYGVNIKGGTVKGGGEVRISARDEFANTKDITVTLKVDDTTVKESPCGTNIKWNISGNAKKTVC
ncbi:hypothetical protein P280DRAFT_467809 [Massarina eburnea CBS 473.64]|uniref:Parallel beta-helix repeat protein n=1 Tax=Massarina eburnea CBS 473.64 TaxID=1395130 RepID=A0A6A6S4B4_9PLEO|nr:hypothetical protein P280DRAFT_467809 [Massarina eburnea CBS 473.64]